MQTGARRHRHARCRFRLLEQWDRPLGDEKGAGQVDVDDFARGGLVEIGDVHGRACVGEQRGETARPIPLAPAVTGTRCIKSPSVQRNYASMTLEGTSPRVPSMSAPQVVAAMPCVSVSAQYGSA